MSLGPLPTPENIDQPQEIPSRILDLLIPDFVEQNLSNLHRNELKDLQPSCVKGIGYVYEYRLEKLNIKSIESLSNQMNPNSLMDSLGINEDLVLRWLIASDIITLYSKGIEEQRPIIVAGLEGSGKSSLIMSLKSMTTSAAPTPTSGIYKEEIEFMKIKIPIIELGGAPEQLQSYLSEPPEYLKNAMLLIYVIDVTKATKMAESLDYLKDLIKILINTGELPNLRVLLNKYDPQYRHQNDAVVKHVSLKLEEMFKTEFHLPNKEIYKTSIFEIPTLIKAFSALFRDISPISRIIATTFQHLASLSSTFAGFVFTENGFVISEWTKRLPEDRRNTIFDETYNIIKDKGHDPGFYRMEIKSIFQGIYIIIERVEVAEATFFLASVNTKTESIGEQNLKQLQEQLSPWIKNFFSVGNKRIYNVNS